MVLIMELGGQGPEIGTPVLPVHNGMVEGFIPTVEVPNWLREGPSLDLMSVARGVLVLVVGRGGRLVRVGRWMRHPQQVPS